MTVTDKISASQVIGTFGVGSLYDLRVYSKHGQQVTSVTIAGLDAWEPHLKGLRRISEPVLQHALNVRELLEPPGCPSDKELHSWTFSGPFVPVVRFPEWMVCSGCQRLGKVGREFNGTHGQNTCLARTCRGHGVPVRLVATCFDADKTVVNPAGHPGHLEEFPWHWWAHSLNSELGCSDVAPELKLVRSSRSAALSGLRVLCLKRGCVEHNVGRSLDGVFGDSALKKRSCSGLRPWLEDSEPCGRPIRAVMRGASNAYFPVTASALSIPPTSSACKQAVGDIWKRTLQPFVDAGAITSMSQMLVAAAQNASPQLQRYSSQQVLDAIVEFASPESSIASLPATSEEQRAVERRAIVQGLSDEDGSGRCLFQSEPVTALDRLAGGAALGSYVSSLCLVHRLREVKVLRGFQRLKPPLGDPYTAPCAPLSRSKSRWLPAVQVYGEGLFYELNPDNVAVWATQPAVIARSNVLTARYAAAQPNLDISFVKPEFMLVHTLTHLLINQLALDCGYSSSSLRERIYVGRDEREGRWCGALIYTSTSSADGTLGGLVRQGQPDLFGRTLEAAIDNAKWCSSDPLCIDSTGQGVDALNLAACHACAIVSETSCEQRNMLLDRALVVGTAKHPQIGFFSHLLPSKL